jgi:5,10-methylenetetrahydromethanopterin reductase
VVVAHAAEGTERIALGVGITSPYTRLPVQIARAAATVDELSGGRFKLGLGTANVANVLTPLGIPMEKPVKRLRDSIELIRALLRGETVDFVGDYDVMRKIALEFTPGRAEIPIYLGTRGSGMLALSGELADGVLVESLFNRDGFSYVFENIDRGAERVSRDLATLDTVSWQVVQVTEDVEAALAAKKSWLARTIQVGPRPVLERLGMDPAVLDAVEAHNAAGDKEAAAAAVTDDTVRCTMIIGGPDEVAERVGGVLRSRATALNLLLLGPTEELASTLRRFVDEVLPRVEVDFE